MNLNYRQFFKLLFWFLCLFGFEKLIKHWDIGRFYYTQYFYYPLQIIRNFLFKDIVFSVGDLLYLIFSIVIIVAIVQFSLTIFHRKKASVDAIFNNGLYRLLRLGLFLYTFFVLSWGINYTRQPLLYNYYKDDFVFDDLLQRKSLNIQLKSDTLIANLNFVQSQLLKYKSTWQDTTKYTNDNINDLANAYFTTYVKPTRIAANLKKSSIGKYLQFVGIQGYFVPFTGEVHYSGDMFYLYKPFVFLHEMAHQKGIASELDANFFAYVLSMHTNDSMFTSSALFELMGYLMSDLKRVDSFCYKHYTSVQLHQDVKILFELASQHRSKYKNSIIRPYTMGLYDGFLRFFGQNDGLKSYSMMTYKVMLYRKYNITLEDILNELNN